MAVVAVAVAVFDPSLAPYMSFPCLLAATLEGTLLGSLLPPSVNKILHPIIVTCLSVNAGAALFGAATGMGWHSALQSYMTKVSNEVCSAKMILTCGSMHKS